MKITYGYLKEFLDNPEEYGAIKTGSNLFEVDSENSDIDYFITEEDWYKINPEIIKIFFEQDWYKDNLFNSVHFKYNNKIYNILVMGGLEFICWKFATDMFLKMMDSKYFRKIIIDKDKRVELFEFFKNNCREIRK